MKKVLLSLMSIGFALGMQTQAQTIFSSNFSVWNGANPQGWVGSKTNFGASGVGEFEKVEGESIYGDAAVRLNVTSPHRRFTTQPFSVTEGTSYLIKFWAKGTGQIRVGLFDDNPGDGFGYIYGTYNTLSNVSDYSEYSGTVTALKTTTNAEFILSVLNTSGTHIVVDSVAISEVTIENTSIYDIQFTTQTSGQSPLAGQSVVTKGIVTAVNPENGFFMQDGVGAWNGIYVFRQTNQPAIGAEVEVSGKVQEFNNWTQIGQVSNITVLSEDNPLPPAIEITTQEMNTEQYESVLVRLVAASTVSTPNGFGEWTVNDGSGVAMVQNQLFTFNPSVGIAYDVRGPVAFSFSNFKVWPRGSSDITVSMGVANAGKNIIANVFPNPSVETISVSLNVDFKGKDIEYSLIDLNGKTVLHESLMSFEGNTVLINVSKVKAGTYMLNILSNGTRSTQKVIIQ
jgi:hypothetical protein